MPLSKNTSDFLTLVKVGNYIEKEAKGNDLLKILLPILGVGGAGALAYTQRDKLSELFKNIFGGGGEGGTGINIPGQPEMKLPNVPGKKENFPPKKQGDPGSKIPTDVTSVAEAVASGNPIGKLNRTVSGGKKPGLDPVNRANFVDTISSGINSAINPEEFVDWLTKMLSGENKPEPKTISRLRAGEHL
jgi:hypothetical protein